MFEATDNNLQTHEVFHKRKLLATCKFDQICNYATYVN